MWSAEQLAALDALKIPRYDLCERPGSPAVQAAQADVTETPTQVALYQLGPWLLQFPTPLPVGNFPWLMDLSQYIESRPTLVSSAGQKPVIDCSPYAKSRLTPEEKRALWNLLKPFITQ
ncbi:hypothetical protein [Aliidiomarina celeris]|uniref:hypothetical protein n=1 Tax=Aliidiomarina celeris TaxID=2249428 RepID=UPI000DE96B80|nr:hypothetical protein [Aliidiomarina celeris]